MPSHYAYPTNLPQASISRRAGLNTSRRSAIESPDSIFLVTHHFYHFVKMIFAKLFSKFQLCVLGLNEAKVAEIESHRNPAQYFVSEWPKKSTSIDFTVERLYVALQHIGRQEIASWMQDSLRLDIVQQFLATTSSKNELNKIIFVHCYYY